jgi:hypothetical protein
LIAALGILLRVIIAYVVLPPDAGFAADLMTVAIAYLS